MDVPSYIQDFYCNICKFPNILSIRLFEAKIGRGMGKQFCRVSKKFTVLWEVVLEAEKTNSGGTRTIHNRDSERYDKTK